MLFEYYFETLTASDFSLNATLDPKSLMHVNELSTCSHRMCGLDYAKHIIHNYHTIIIINYYAKSQ